MINLNESVRTILREKVITGADKYNRYLMNKVFLVVCEDGSLHNVRFFAKDFQHLTGVLSDLSEGEFFTRCSNRTLSVNNIAEQQKYNASTLRYKTDVILDIEKIIYGDSSESLFMINLHTRTCDYPVAIRNQGLQACVGFKQTSHRARTIRKYSNSGNADDQLRIVGIFAKTQEESKYTELVYLINNATFSALEIDFNLFSDEIIARLS